MEHQTIDTGEVPRQTFDAAKEEVVKLMEKESLQDFLASDLYSNLRRRINAGELEALIKEDIDTVREIMSKEVRRGDIISISVICAHIGSRGGKGGGRVLAFLD